MENSALKSFYIIHKSHAPDSYLTKFSTDPINGGITIEFGYVNNSCCYSSLTEAQEIVKVLRGSHSGLPTFEYEIFICSYDDEILKHIVAGTVIWSTED